MKLRTSLLVAVLGIVIATIIAAALASSLVIARAAERQLVAEVRRSRDVYRDLAAYRTSLARSEARVMAEEPRLKAVVATEEITHETALGVATELKKALRADLFVVVDRDGALLADVTDPGAFGHDMNGQPLIARAFETGDASGFWSDDRHVYGVQARRLQHGATTVGAVVIGYRLDDRVARAVLEHQGSAACVVRDGRVIAAAAPGIELAELGRALEGAPNRGAREIRVNGERWLAESAPYPDWSGPGELRYAVLRSVDQALAPSRRLQLLLYAIAGFAILASIAAAVVIANRISRPIDALVGFTREIAEGKLDARAAPGGATEVRTLATAMNRMAGELSESRRQLAHKERLEKELEIAAHIQTSILPRMLQARAFDVAARMHTASEVGGDYYDVIPVDRACWIGVGDVAGHGLTAGLVMMMVQSGIANLVRQDPDAPPSRLLATLNRAVFDNVRDRMRQDEYVTLSLLRCDVDGTVTVAGAHQDVLVSRASRAACERIEIPGTWVALIPDIADVCPERSIALGRGDLIALYTDGITEATDDRGEMFGVERLANALHDARGLPVDEVCARVFEVVRSWTSRQDDDMTLVVARYRGDGEGEG